MTRWTHDRLHHIAHGNDFHIAPDRDADLTPGRLIWVWAVTIDEDIYVRSANPDSRWFASAVTYRRGSVSIAGNALPAEFTLVTRDAVKDQVDDAYRDKYADDPYLSEDLLESSRNQIARVRPLETLSTSID
ncbi:DUF2255 family protein [Embleya scabrispora]|uniref:DUF2255 family protein n=1 Tax=Embleya scabrispora TaxID=159449 RepID=UPI000380C804|nr:DUF2255 family protein [Embleya scabrispora]MYS85748.1 DUF2255 family protein [Streptomyces sp. SID5474]